MAYYATNDDISYTPFTAQEEADHFAIYYAGHEPAATQARDELIRRHLKLVAKLAIQCAGGCLTDDWAISAGNMGLMKAITNKKFNPKRGFLFATYVRTFVRGQVFSTIKSSMNLARVVPHGNDNTPEATITGVNTPEYGHAPIAAPHGYTEPSVEHSFEAEDLANARAKALKNAIARLKGLEAKSLKRISLQGHTCRDVAADEGVSWQAVHQAHQRAVKRLTRYLSPLRKELV